MILLTELYKLYGNSKMELSLTKKKQKKKNDDLFPCKFLSYIQALHEFQLVL